MIALPEEEESRLAADGSVEWCCGTGVAKKDQAIKVARKGLAHVECSRTRKMEVAVRAAMVCMGSLLS
ncbi:hypothetical protein ACQKOH_19040 [Sphingomonas sp. NPDC092331]|jgi:hypothetical protein